MTDNQTNGSPADRPETVSALLERIADERRPLEQAAANLDDDALSEDSRGWSVKDHLAHVTAWEQRLLAEIRGDHAAERFGLEEGEPADTDSINAMIYARHLDDQPDDVRAAFAASGVALRTTFTSMGDAELQKPARPDDPLVENVVDLISWDTYRHYPHHARAIVEKETWPKPKV